MKKELLIFDLDGTLIDSSADIAWVANETLKSLGRPEMTGGQIRARIGWGIKMLLQQLLPNISEAGLDEARKIFLEYYEKHLVVETRFYDGVAETIEGFARQGKRMAIVTNKPFNLTMGILKELDLDGHFKAVLGGDSLPVRKPDPAPLIHVMAALGVTPEDTAFVGDSRVDVEAGKGAGVFTIGAAYGFRGREELETAGADIIIEGFSELTGIFA
jgi:phosphoglycolate phosphatase